MPTWLKRSRRTPPGVRELKLLTLIKCTPYGSRTPPGVRELKPLLWRIA